MKNYTPFITASIVTYNTEPKVLAKLISCFDFKLINRVFIIDNSKNDNLCYFGDSSRIIYIHNPQNPGYGAAHNIAIINAIKLNSDFHFIINPDVSFEPGIISKIIFYCQENSKIGMLMPQILNFDDTIQYLPKFLPTLFSIFLRKLKIFNNKLFIDYEMRNIDQNLIYNTPVLSGCFTLLRISAIKHVGMYDDRFFMYFEDWDLSRRMHEYYYTIYYPKVSVYHEYQSGANKNIKLFFIYIQSMFRYFNKWGWIFDNKRSSYNNKLSTFIQKK